MIEEKPLQQAHTKQPAQFQVEAAEAALMDPDKWNQLAGDEMFVIRKETISHANEELNKKLSKEYQISKLDYRRKSAQLKDLKDRVVYDYESYPEKRDMFVLREIFAKDSRSNELMKQNHEKIKKRVERISKATQAEDSLTLRDPDIARFVIKGQEALPSTTRTKVEHGHKPSQGFPK